MKGTVFPRPSMKDPESGARRPVRGSTWTYAFSVVRGGKRRQITKGGFRTKSDAEAALREAMSAHANGTHVEPSRLTLADYLRAEWLPLVRASKKASTAHGYEHLVEKRIIPDLGDHRLSDLTSGDVVTFLTSLRSKGGRKDSDGNALGLSERSLKNTFTVLHSALDHAVEAGLLARNPAAKLPRAARPQPRQTEMRTWTADELRSFLLATSDDRYSPAYIVAAMTGLRRSEVLGLRWSDVDLSAATLSVTRGRVAAGYEVAEGETKTGRGRKVSLDDETVATFKRWRKVQLEERLAWGDAWAETGLVFTREDGTGIHPHSLSEAFERAVKRSGLPVIRFHDLRHTHASLLLRAGVHPKVVQERLGHSSIAITLDIYSHVAPGMQEAAAAQLGALVFG